LLRDREKSVGELATIMDVRQPTISQHLAVLRQRGVVSPRKEGANIFYEITNPRFIEACDIIREVLLERLAGNAELAKQYGEEK